MQGDFSVGRLKIALWKRALASTTSVFGYDSDHFCPQGKDKDVCNPRPDTLDIFSIKSWGFKFKLF